MFPKNIYGTNFCGQIFQKDKSFRINVYTTIKRNPYETFMLECDGMAECAASWTEDLMVGSLIPTVAQGNIVFPAQKDERHQEQFHSPGVEH